MKILHLATVDMSLELLLGDQMSELRARGHEVHAASAPGEFVDSIERRGVVFHPLNRSTRSISLLSDFAVFAEFVSLVRGLEPDVIHTHNPKPGVYGRVLGRLATDARIVNTVHGLYAQRTDPLGKRLACMLPERLAASFSHVELFQNGEDRDTYRHWKVDARKLRLIGNGVNLTRFRPPSEAERLSIRTRLGLEADDLVFGSVGRLVKEKGFEELLNAFAQAKNQVDGAVKLIIVGPNDSSRDDGLSPASIDKAKSNGVQFLGHRNDVAELYWALDVFVSASHREGFPRSVMESIASGTPVIGTDIRGTRDAISEGTNGWLVPVENPGELARLMARLSGNRVEVVQVAEGCRDHAVRHFDFNDLVDQSVAAYSTAGRY